MNSEQIQLDVKAEVDEVGWDGMVEMEMKVEGDRRCHAISASAGARHKRNTVQRRIYTEPTSPTPAVLSTRRTHWHQGTLLYFSFN